MGVRMTSALLKAQLNSDNFTGGQSPEAIALWKRYLAALQADV